MEENKTNEGTLTSYMENIVKAMKLSKEKQEIIEDKSKELYEQDKYVFIEEGQNEIKQLKKEKEEFDNMTVESLIHVKKQILLNKQNIEREYQEMAEKSLKAQKEIESKLQSMMSRQLSEEKVEMVRNSAEKAKNKLKQDMEKFQKLLTLKRAKLDELDKSVEQFALELGVEDKLDNVSISEKNKLELTLSEEELLKEDDANEKSETKQEDKSETKQEEKSETKQEDKSETKQEDELETKQEDKSETKQEEKSETKQEDKSETKQEGKSETKQEEKSETKQEEKSETKREEKSETKQEDKSETKQEDESETKQEEKSKTKQEEKSETKQEDKSKTKQEDKAEAAVQFSSEEINELKNLYRKMQNDIASSSKKAETQPKKEYAVESEDGTFEGKHEKVVEGQNNNIMNNKDMKKAKLVEININESLKKVTIKKEDEQEISYNLDEILKTKKKLFAKSFIKKNCKYICNSSLKGRLLARKVNPAIVWALKDDDNMRDLYLTCLVNKKELPFKIIHDLRDSKLSFFKRWAMRRYAKAEDKIHGTEITFAEGFWNKNRALPESKKKDIIDEQDEILDGKYKSVEKERNMREEIKVYNKDNHIEENANRIFEEEEAKLEVQRAKEVKDMMNASEDQEKG